MSFAAVEKFYGWAKHNTVKYRNIILNTYNARIFFLQQTTFWNIFIFPKK